MQYTLSTATPFSTIGIDAALRRASAPMVTISKSRVSADDHDFFFPLVQSLFSHPWTPYRNYSESAN